MTEPKMLVLTIDLTPHFMSGLALRKRVTKHTWRFRIRKSLLAERGAVCEICSFPADSTHIIDAHEVYEFPGDGTVQLASIQLLCTHCHDIKDFAQTERLIAQGIKPAARRELVIEHFCRVNDCTRSEFDKHLENAYDRLWEIQRKYGPTIAEDRINYGPFQEEFIKCQERRRAIEPHRRGPSAMNWFSATERAIKIATRSRIHPDCRDEIMEIAAQSAEFRRRILPLVRDGQCDAAIALVIEFLEEVREPDEAAWGVLPDHEFHYAGR